MVCNRGENQEVIMDYKEFYGLKELPFVSSPDERYYYNSPQHSRAIMKLSHVAENMLGLGVLIGDIGTGKTTISRKMLETFSSRDDYIVGLLVIVHSEITPLWLLQRIAMQLGIKDVPQEKVEIISLVYRQLMKYRKEGKKTVIMIDEANMLNTREIMEEFRGLLNMEHAGQHLLTFLMFGMPELEPHLRLDPPLYERINVRVVLKPLDVNSLVEYITHRLKVAGATRMMFTKDALQKIYIYSKGKPRLINTLCDNALLEGFLQKLETINGDIIDIVAEDAGLKPQQSG